MKARENDPRRLDVERLAREGATLSGQWPLDSLQRLAGAAHPDLAPAEGSVAWEVRGEARPVRGAAPQVWLHLTASTRIGLECQRCLQPVEVPVEARRSFLFVRGEAEAEALDADCEDDVLALARAIDLRELVEDELLLSLPLVPRHDRCSMPVANEPDAPVEDEPREHPFAALEALKARNRRP